MTRTAPDSTVSNNYLVSTIIIIIYPYVVPIYPWTNYGNSLGSPLHLQGGGASPSIIQVKVRLVHISHNSSQSSWIIHVHYGPMTITGPQRSVVVVIGLLPLPTVFFMFNGAAHSVVLSNGEV